jgi:DNA-directed RNA polymerase subunit K/omega
VTEDVVTQPPPVEPDERYAVSPQERRFLFVDIAALRAKQLRRGALNRLPHASGVEPIVPAAVLPRKAERVAMEEVRRGFIQFEVPGSTAGQPTVGEDA